ncbi:uncharacterized protein LOC143195088 isoform X2 [Rhynchophorus ferrugineus]|uniref:uncharacterized protein LOC143195088 isoform X2 n=1 Tax=Rhynchophorus ferrugineus TaxID=354439 RepID=UPI003FCE7FC2
MLIHEGVQTNKDMEKKTEARIVQEGMELLRKQKDESRRKKLKEQQEMRDMLERYWPFGKASDAKPRGLRNLRLEELFPNKDYQNAKRCMGPLDWGSPGCGAPIVRDGKRFVKTREDPMLRFQFGKDLRRAVDNTFRYKTNREEQVEYKKALDKLVEEKKQNQLRQKLLDAENEKRHGWSSEETLKKLEIEAAKKKHDDQRNYNNFKNTQITPPNRVVKLDPVVHPSNFKELPRPVRNKRLSPLSNDKENGVELTDLLAKDRKIPTKIPLSSTDVTKEKDAGRSCVWNRQGSTYLKELTQQMISKKEKMQEMKVQEDETARQHFSTWTNFWGKPGHGAPRSAVKKGAIDRLLYPQMVPIGVA